MLNKDNSVLVIIDIQDRLVAALSEDTIVKKSAILAEAARILGVPVVVTEQYPQGLGPTVSALKEKFSSETPIVEKTAFSALQEPSFKSVLESTGRKRVIICGIETHVCVHQSAADLLDAGYEVYVAKDACASRNKYEFKMGIERMQSNGAKISCVEIILFEWLRGAKAPNFKEIQALIK